VQLAVTSPDRLIEAWRHRRDGWSTAMPLAHDLRREALETQGYGFHLRTESDGRLRVTDVVSGSPAHARACPGGTSCARSTASRGPAPRLARAAGRCGAFARRTDGTVREAT
jgi:hypothetical protein